MKVLRIFGNIIIGIIIFGLVLAFSVIKSTQNFLEKEAILGVVKSSLSEVITKEVDNVKNKPKELIGEIFSDKETDELVKIVINSFHDYQNDKVNFFINDGDVEKIYSYAMRHKDQIVKLTGKKVTEITDEEFKKIFSSENINKFVNEVFEEISDDLGDEIDNIIELYNQAVSPKVTYLLIGLIVFFIIILGLINWSLYKWMLILGIDMIICGIILAFIYGAGTMVNDIINASKMIKEAIGEINFTGYAIFGGIELLIGVILIVAYNVIDSRTLNKQIKDLEAGL